MKKTLFILAVVCLAFSCGKKEEAAPAGGSGGSEGGAALRTTFVEGCVAPMEEQFGKDKATKICGCMFDEGTSKWSLGDFMKKAMEQGDEVQQLAIKCVTSNM